MKCVFAYLPTEREEFLCLSQNRFSKFRGDCELIYPLIPASGLTLLKKIGFEVFYIDSILEKLNIENFIERLKEINPDLLIYETKTPVVKQSWKIIDKIKEKLPNIKIAACGDHVSVLPLETMENSKVDFVITGGDFDVGMLKLAKYLSKNEEMPKGLYYRENGKIMNTGEYELITNLDYLPFIDREIIPWDNYHEGWTLKKNFMYMMASRGCAYRCSFCVDGDTVIVLNEKGKIKTKKILELFEGEDVEIKEIQNNEIKNIENREIYIFSDKGFTRINKISRRINKGEINKIVLASNRYLLASDDHNLPVYENNDFTLKKVRELKEGDKIGIMKKLPENNLKEINLIEEMRKFPETWRDVFVHCPPNFLKKINYFKNNNDNLSTRYRRIKEDYMPLKEFYDFKKKLKLDYKKFSLQTKGSELILPVNFKLNLDLMRLLGYFVSEGYYNQKSIVITNSRNEIIEDIKKSINKVFDKTYMTISKDNRTSIIKGRRINSKTERSSIYFGGNLVRILFEKIFGIKGGAKNKNIPDIVFNIDKSLKAEFLRALFSGDGEVRGSSIGFSSRSFLLREQVSLMLNSFGIENCIVDEWDKVYKRYQYRLKINSWDDKYKFNDMVGFYDENKREKLQNIIKLIPWRVRIFMQLDAPKTILELSDTLKTSRGHIQIELYRRIKEGLIIRDKRESVYLYSKPFGGYLRERVKDVYPINRIDKVEDKCYLYDLETENNYFYANSFLIHNCSWPAMLFKYKLRMKSVSKVLDEMELLIKKYNAEEIFFDDDTFTCNKKWVMDFCDGIVKRKINVLWSCNGRVDNTDKEMLETMKKSGCRLIKYGIESANQGTLDRIKKGYTIEQVIESFRLSKEIGILRHGTVMIGYPWESKKDIEKTINFVKSLDVDTVQFSIPIVYPGTELFKEAKENNWLAFGEEWEKYDMSKPSLKHPELKPEEIVELCQKAWKKVYFQPKFIIRKALGLRNMDQVKWTYKGAKTVLSDIWAIGK